MDEVPTEEGRGPGRELPVSAEWIIGEWMTGDHGRGLPVPAEWIKGEKMTGDSLQLGPLREDVAMGGDYLYLLSGSKVSG